MIATAEKVLIVRKLHDQSTDIGMSRVYFYRINACQVEDLVPLESFGSSTQDDSSVGCYVLCIKMHIRMREGRERECV